MHNTAIEYSPTRRGRMPLIMLFAFAFLLAACDNTAVTPDTLEGAWLGQGTFRTAAGDAQVKAQLELLADGSYRLLILEPAILALTGPETGTWASDEHNLTLTPLATTPQNHTPSPDDPPFQQLRTGSQPTVKSLTIADNLAHLQLRDGPLRLTFKPNPAATAALREASRNESP